MATVNRHPLHARGARGIIGKIFSYLALGIATMVFLIPFYLLLRNALATDAEITAPDWKFFPSTLHWENISELFNDPMVPMARSIMNSAIVAVLSTLGTLFLSATAGYGLARIPYRHSNKIFGLVIVTLMIPGAITFVPSFVMVSTLGWISDLRGLIIPGLFSGFTTFLCRQYFLNFPRELEEAARVDGLGYWGSFWRIVMPNSGNFLAAVAVISFIGHWNAFLWPLVIGRDPSSWTVQVALSTFLTAQTVKLHELFMAATVSIIPLMMVFLFLQRYLVQGVAQTGIKG